MLRSLLLSSVFLAMACSAAPPKPAPPPPAKPPPPVASTPRPSASAAAPGDSGFTFTEAMIPMRDGVKLQTVIFAPKAASGPLPFLFIRTPYGVPADDAWTRRTRSKRLFEDGYIFVAQNLRGRFKSEGTFVMVRPPRDLRDPRAIDESTDAYDTIEWLLHHVPGNNGRVGMMGTSYDAWTATMALLDPHPALKAICEQASPADQFIGDDFHHNGAFRLSYGFEYAALLESEKEKNTDFQFDRRDTYEWYLALGPLANANDRYFHGTIKTWNDFIEHPNRDAFWDKQSFAAHLKKTTVPVMNVAGWWDQEDFYGPVKIYDLLEPNDAERRNYLVVGPWNHGGWGGAGRKLGDIDFGSDTGDHWTTTMLAPWFAFFLHDKGKLEQPEAMVFETGSNRWRSFDRWPPAGAVPKRLYLRAGGLLSFAPPTETGPDAADSYVSDPGSPVPYVRRPIPPTYQGSEWPIWQVLDQRFADHRPDVLTWRTEALKEDVVIDGAIVADLFASTSGTDSDWIVKLIDVYPDGRAPEGKAEASEETRVAADKPADLRGYELMIVGEVLRGRFRSSFARPEPIPSGKIVEYKLDLHTNAHAFLKGHRIMVQIQSSWFPLIDRNPQRYVENMYLAKESDYTKATQRIARAREAASAIILPVLAP